MDRKHSVKGRLLIIICYVSYSLQVQHQFVLEDEKVFTDCVNVPPGTMNATAMFDFTNMTFAMDENGIFVEGNITTVWDVQPTDTVLMTVSFSYFDRGTWIPTVLNIATKDLCRVLYDERQYWYKFWFKHVSNVKDVKDKCVKNPGTILIFEPFYTNIVLGFDMPLRSGRYIAMYTITAQDLNGNMRDNAVCIALRGDINKIVGKN